MAILPCFLGGATRLGNLGTHARRKLELLLRIVWDVASGIDIREVQSYGCAAPDRVEERRGENLEARLMISIAKRGHGRAMTLRITRVDDVCIGFACPIGVEGYIAYSVIP